METEKLNQLLARIRKDSETQDTSITTPDYNYKDEWKILAAILCGRPNYEFQIDDHNQAAIESLVRYFNNDPEGTLDPKKGLCLMGPNGSGKSELMAIFQIYLDYRGLKRYRIQSAEAIRIEYKIEGGVIIDKYSRSTTAGTGGMGQKPFELCIDEFGIPDQARHFGDQEEVINSILFLRYELFKKGIRTHLTTNLNRQMITKHYEGRLASRLDEMVNFIKIDGPDRRKSK